MGMMSTGVGIIMMFPTVAANPVGLWSTMALERLPFLHEGTTVHYEGSIDKQGGNADWDWWLYEEDGEWVLFDVDGPGCLCNFVQHRYPTSETPTFRFYFDGEAEPRFELRPEDFGKKAPFLAPLADIYEGPVDNGRGPIWVVRSFVPMPFRKGCKVTSTVKLLGNDKARGEGGWGHVVYHRYPTAEDVETFTGREDFEPLRARLGELQVPPETRLPSTEHTIPPGGRVALLDTEGPSVIRALALQVRDYTPADLAHLWIRMQWDNHAFPDVDLPLGAYFGNLFGNNALRFVVCGMDAKGGFDSRWPMPYWEHARVELVNHGPEARVVLAAVDHEASDAYPQQACGYFRASRYYPETVSVRGHDTVLADVSGRGHIVGGIIRGRSVNGGWASCEGDVRLYIDGIATPQIESDGSESWSCYGWGFPTPPENNPIAGYDGSGPPPCKWSMMRTCLDAVYPFRTGFRFGIEAHGHNDADIAHTGAIFYYGADAPGLVCTDFIDIGEAESEQDHGYATTGSAQVVRVASCYENDEALLVRDTGRAIEAVSEFTVRIRPDNTGVRLRRRADQRYGRQRARVYVDGEPVVERTWYFADRNPHCRWLEDEFEIAEAYTRGKESIRIRMERVNDGASPAWSEFGYWVFTHLPTAPLR